MDDDPLDGFDPEAVARAVRPHLRPTTLHEPRLLGDRLGLELVLASETFQHSGSFKLRAATAVVEHARAPHLLAASSGNFGAALALAARRAGRRCTIVMPATSAAVKIAAVAAYGATVELVDTTVRSRGQRVAELAAALGDVEVVSAYDDGRVICGNATLGEEIFARERPGALIVPLGGGGLAAGLVVARDRFAPATPIWGAEPLLANDGARSLRAGRLLRDDHESTTLCDGARTPSLGRRNFAILQAGLAGILEVGEESVVAALGLLFHLAHLKVEPTAALAVAALLQSGEPFRGRRVVAVVSGANVDPALYLRLLREAPAAAAGGAR